MIKQTGGSTSCPWTTILGNIEIELLRNEFSEGKIWLLTYQVSWAIRIDEIDILGNFSCVMHYFLLLPSKYMKIQIVYGYLLQAVPIINFLNFPDLGFAQHGI